MTAPLSLVREAFEYSGEKNFPLALMLYPTVFGSEWRSAMLAFAYLKCLDDGQNRHRGLVAWNFEQGSCSQCGNPVRDPA
jgi:hypothetical protein